VKAVAVLSAFLTAALAFPAVASASQLIARDAVRVTLAVNSNGDALVTYRKGVLPVASSPGARSTRIRRREAARK
jgi:hypothetical protein